MAHERAFCPRCNAVVPVRRFSRAWRIAFGVWVATVAALLLLFPILSADYCVMLPSFMIVLAAGGPLHGLAARPTTCRRCNRELPGPARDVALS